MWVWWGPTMVAGIFCKLLCYYFGFAAIFASSFLIPNSSLWNNLLHLDLPPAWRSHWPRQQRCPAGSPPTLLWTGDNTVSNFQAPLKRFPVQAHKGQTYILHIYSTYAMGNFWQDRRHAIWSIRHSVAVCGY